MLLTRLATTLRRIRTEDRGAGMAAVVGLMAVSLLTTSVVATSVVTATQYTTVTRAGVESQAAAEAGIAVARAGLLTGTCDDNDDRYASAPGSTPEYVATIWIPSGSSWVRGCPTGTATQVRILSTGFAEREGVAGSGGRDETNLEVILSSISVPSTIEATGPAVYAYSSQGFGGGGTLVTTGGSEASILIKQGDVNCTGGASGDADIVVNNGNLTVSGGCVITGNAYASGRITLPGGPDIGGNAIANAVTLSGGSEIGGSVWVNQDVTMSGGPEIGGTVTAGSLSFSGGTIGQNAWIYGATTVNWGAVINGSLTTKTFSKPNWSTDNTFVKGTLTVVPAGPGTSPYPARPAWPIVPDWINFAYDPTDWSGFAVATISSSGSCSYTQVKNAVTSFAGQNGIVNALGCVGGVSIGGSDVVTLNQDVAIFSPKFTLSGGGGFTASTTRKLWLITPDNVVETPTTPTCTTGENSFSTSGGFWFSSNLRVMMYTPCKVVLSSSTAFTGQVFSGQAGIAGGATLTYTAVGLPGYNLDTGLTTTVEATEEDRAIVSFRNVEDGN